MCLDDCIRCNLPASRIFISELLLLISTLTACSVLISVGILRVIEKFCLSSSSSSQQVQQQQHHRDAQSFSAAL